MNVLEKLAELQARPRDIQGTKDAAAIEDVERSLKATLPEGLRSALTRFSHAIDFNTVVLFKPIECSGWEDRDGALDLLALYGLNADDWSILEMNETYAGRLPANCIAIGESSGGNQICLERGTDRVYFWDHESSSIGRYLIANSFDDFVDSLYEGDNSIEGPSGIIEGESYLDF